MPFQRSWQERRSDVGRLRAVESLHAVQDPGGPVDAEAALARAHAEPQAAPDVVEVLRAAPAHGLLELGAADQLALADQLLLLQGALAAAQPRAERVELAVLVAGRRDLGSCGTDGRSPSCSHMASTRSWAISRNVVSLPPDMVSRPWTRRAPVVDDGVGAADVARVGDLARARVLEQRPRARPDPQRARLPEARHEPFAVVEHLVDLFLRDGQLIRIGVANVGRADHADRADRHQDVAVRRNHAAVDHRVHQPMVHGDHDPLARDHADVLDARPCAAICAAHGPEALRMNEASMSSSSPVQLVAHARARHRLAVAVQGDHA